MSYGMRNVEMEFDHNFVTNIAYLQVVPRKSFNKLDKYCAFMFLNP